MTVQHDDDDIFGEIMEAVGLRGKFQTRFNLTFNLVFVLLAAMPFLNLVLAMVVPDHWCHVPGREHTNFTVDEWKALTIPRAEESSDVITYKKCEMYDIANSTFTADGPPLLRNGSKPQVVGCRHGWDYDHTWYQVTAPSQQDWVCDQAMQVTNVFVFQQVGLVVGTFVFGQLGDLIGRRPTFFIAIASTALGRCLLIPTAGAFPAFLTMAIIGSAAEGALFQAPLAISMEVSDSRKRAHIAMLQCFGWTSGMCLMPMIAWATGNWMSFVLITSLPCAAFLFVPWLFPESPRWLAARGRANAALRQLRRIARLNGTELPHDALGRLETLAKRKETVLGVLSLFTSWRLIRNTAMLACCRMIGILVYYTMVLNVSNMSGNPFLNFLYQSIVELPGFALGRLMGDRLGRRWTSAGVLLIISVANFLIVGVVKNPDLGWLTVAAVVLIRFLNTIVNYIGYLQGMEIYPTCIRQTGSSVGHVAAGALAIMGPYVVYLGTTMDARYPYAILAAITALGAVLASLLPETLHQRLPETLQEAQTFGSDEPYWSWLGRSHKPLPPPPPPILRAK